jgi:hypothetical protein
MFSIGLPMNCEDRMEVQGSTPLGSRNCERWFSIKVRPLWGPWSGQWSIVTAALVIIGNRGYWLIEPKFDAPFHFENGIAEVLYYGQKRKINEKGEFVE